MNPGTTAERFSSIATEVFNQPNFISFTNIDTYLNRQIQLVEYPPLELEARSAYATFNHVSSPLNHIYTEFIMNQPVRMTSGQLADYLQQFSSSGNVFQTGLDGGASFGLQEYIHDPYFYCFAGDLARSQGRYCHFDVEAVNGETMFVEHGTRTPR